MEIPLRMDIALAGCGRWGARILRDLVELGAQVWVADPSPAARSAAVAAGARAAFSEIEEVPRVTGAIVAAPTLRHVDAVDRLAGRNVPVFCEKPLTADGRSAARLAAIHGLRLFVMDKWRYHPAVEEIGRLRREGTLGPVRSLRTRRIQPDISGYDVDPVWVLAPHELSIGLEILGDVPELRSATAREERGELVGLSATFGTNGAFVFEVSSRAPRRRREITLECRDGIVRWTMEDEHALTIESGGAVTRIELDREPPLRRELRGFLGYLRGGPPPKTGAREGAAFVLLLEEARALAGVSRDGRRVS